MPLDTRKVSLIVPEHKPGEPYRVVLKYTPTGVSAEGMGMDWNEAKAAALAMLEAQVASGLEEAKNA
jgi:hypothetical protein